MSKKSITVRLERDDAEALERLARIERQRTGGAVGLSDIVRGAVREYLEKQGAQ